jgi:putative phage-type endonuclease
MKFVTAEQRTDEWYAARLGRVTGSRFKDVMAVSKKDGSPLQARTDYKKELVTERLIGAIGRKDVFVTPEMAWGQQNEGLARTEYQLRTGNSVSEEGFAQHDELMVGVSTDGLVNDTGNLEIKCLASRNHLYNIAMNGDMPDDYKAQVQGQMWITDRDWCDFVGYDSRLPNGLDLFVTRILRDDDYIGYLEAQILEFIEDIDRDMAFFIQYLPVAKRACRQCGVVFTDQLPVCPACHSNISVIEEVLKPAKIKFRALEEVAA